MKKGWKIVAVLVLVVVILGAACVGAGILMGSDYVRIWKTFDEKYHIGAYWKEYSEWGSDAAMTYADWLAGLKDGEAGNAADAPVPPPPAPPVPAPPVSPAPVPAAPPMPSP